MIRVQALQRDQKKPVQFKKFLQNSKNKTGLIKFIVKDWSTNEENLEKLDGKLRISFTISLSITALGIENLFKLKRASSYGESFISVR